MKDSRDAYWHDAYWMSDDGLRLHARDYSGTAVRPPLLCLPGLTRNARDFAHVGERLGGDWRVLCPELRGRGESQWASDPASYNPARYVADIEALLAQEGITRFVAIGTSLGGLMTMMLAMAAPARIAGALLNDIGPDLEAGGLARIRAYVGGAPCFASWTEATAALAAGQRIAFPDYGAGDWLAMAQKVMRETADGRIEFAYDPAIAQGFAQVAGIEADLWPGIDALAGRPVALVRGALSDLLSDTTLAAMQHRLPGAEIAVVPRVGHAPTLAEPVAATALDRMLARVR